MTQEVYEPKLGDVIYIIKEDMIERTLVCGLHSRSYYAGDYGSLHYVCRLQDVDNSLLVTVLADSDYGYHTFAAACEALRAQLFAGGKGRDVIEEILYRAREREETHSLLAMYARHSLGLADEYYYDRSAYATWYEESDRSRKVTYDEVAIEAALIDSDAWIVDCKNLQIFHGRVTSVALWLPRGYSYTFGEARRHVSAADVFTHKEAALDALEASFEEKSATLVRETVQVEKLAVGTYAVDHQRTVDQMLRTTVRNSFF